MPHPLFERVASTVVSFLGFLAECYDSSESKGKRAGVLGIHFKLPFWSYDVRAQLRPVAALNQRINSKPLEGLRQLARIWVRYCKTLEMATCRGIGGGMD